MKQKIVDLFIGFGILLVPTLWVTLMKWKDDETK